MYVGDSGPIAENKADPVGVTMAFRGERFDRAE